MLRWLWQSYPCPLGTYLPHWTPERARQAEQCTEHYLSGTITAPRARPVVRDAHAVARREARLLAMAQADFKAKRRLA